MKKIIVLILTMIIIFSIFNLIPQIHIQTVKADQPRIQGYVYINDVKTKPQQLRLTFENKSKLGNVSDDGFYSIVFPNVEVGCEGVFTIIFNETLYIPPETVIILEGVYLYNIDLHVNTSGGGEPLNVAPVISNLSIANGSVNISLLTSLLSVTINDPDADSFNWTIQTSPYIGDSSGFNSSNGSKSCSISGLSYSTMYTWFVNVSDGKILVRQSFMFTTRPIYIPSPPSGFSANADGRFKIDLSWIKGSKADCTYIEYNTISTWEMGDGTFLYNGTGSSFSHTNLNPGDKVFYQAWSWNNTDKVYSNSYNSISGITNVNTPPDIGSISPGNGSVNQALSLTFSVYIFDVDGDTFNISIKCNNSQLFSANNAVNGTKHLSLSGLSYDTVYYIWVNVTDGFDWVKKWYTFTTSSNNTTENIPPVADAGGPYTGIVNTTTTFDASDSIDSDGIITGYRWDWTNNGVYDTGWLTNPITTHTYTSIGNFTIKLEIIDNNGSTNTNTTIVSINKENKPPTAEVGGPYTGYVNSTIAFSGSESSDSDGTIVSYLWDWTGDGFYDLSLSKSTAIHKYTTVGTYTVRLKVIDNLGATDTDTTTVTIQYTDEQIIGSNTNPIADAGGPYYEIIGVSVYFDASDSYDPDGTTITYYWSFGDGNTSTLSMPTHTYYIEGNYTIKLTVTDIDNGTNNDTTFVIVTKKPNYPPDKPTITGPVSSNINILCNYSILGFDADGDKLRYIINWDDDTNQTISPLLETNTSFNAFHKWITGGVYFISLCAVDENNAISENQTLKVLIDAYSISSLGYLVDKDGDGVFDVFYSETTDKETIVQKTMTNIL